MKRKYYTKMKDDEVRILKIGRDAIFEFLYETLLGEEDRTFNVDSLKVYNKFAMDWESGEFIFAVCNEPKDEKAKSFCENLDAEKLIKLIPDTTDTVLKDKPYKSYNTEELRELLKSDGGGKE